MAAARYNYLTTKTRVPTILPNQTECLYKYDPARAAECYDFLKAHFKVDRQLVDAEPGIYTWIIKQTDDGPVLVAARPITYQEVGTLHTNLDSVSDKHLGIKGPVVAAGELQMDDVTVEYNLHSGTYMEAIYRRGDEVKTAALENITAEKMVDLFMPERIVAKVDRDILLPFPTLPKNRNRLNRTFKRVPYMKKGGARRTRRQRQQRRSVGGRFGSSRRRV